MKKIIICGVASLTMATMPLFSAFAVDASITGDSAKDVTVGEVDETIYSVDITWGDMSFDWKYNALTNGYAFLGKETSCQLPAERDIYNLAVLGNLYSDYECTTPVEGEVSLGENYYSNVTTAYDIKVWDESVNGRVKAQASFTPSEKYTWVKGVFSDIAMSFPMYVYADNNFDGYTETDGTLTNKMGISAPVAGQPIHTLSDVMFHLEVNEEAEIDLGSIVAGDKIGTVTINIEPDLN